MKRLDFVVLLCYILFCFQTGRVSHYTPDWSGMLCVAQADVAHTAIHLSQRPDC